MGAKARVAIAIAPGSLSHRGPPRGPRRRLRAPEPAAAGSEPRATAGSRAAHATGAPMAWSPALAHSMSCV